MATSESGGRYFICGGQKVIPTNSKTPIRRSQTSHASSLNDNFLKPPVLSGQTIRQSPCYEYTLGGLLTKKDMVNFRTYFSLVCLVKLEKPLGENKHGSLHSGSKSKSGESSHSYSGNAAAS